MDFPLLLLCMEIAGFEIRTTGIPKPRSSLSRSLHAFPPLNFLFQEHKTNKRLGNGCLLEKRALVWWLLFFFRFRTLFRQKEKQAAGLEE